MAVPPVKVEIRRRIQAPAAEVFRAFSRASLLRDWLCQAAHADARKGGRLYLGWSNGDSMMGEYVTVVPDQKLAFTWLGKKSSGPSRVTTTLTPRGQATDVLLRQSLPGRGPQAQRDRRALTRLWETSLENLQSLLETGEDLRYTRRPMLGITVNDFGPEQAKKMRVPVSEGVRLDGVIAGMGAEAAGLEKDDVVISIGGRTIRGWSTLAPALSRHRAGDQVLVHYYRGPERRTTLMTLSGRRMPAIPPEPAGLATELRQVNAGLNRELEESLRDVSEEQAGRRPGPGEWSAKHVLAHLIAGERDWHGWIAEVLEADEPVEAPGNVAARMDAMVDTLGTVAALLEELKRNQEITARMVECLPPEAVARRAAYWKIGHNLLQPEDHVRGHIGQIRAALAAEATG